MLPFFEDTAATPDALVVDSAAAPHADEDSDAWWTLEEYRRRRDEGLIERFERELLRMIKDPDVYPFQVEWYHQQWVNALRRLGRDVPVCSVRHLWRYGRFAMIVKER